ncbi:ABC transporter substrate-binding protein [Dietzia sp. NCCP-2495]|uniref:ABC transporter substrate-binding protein n=1 Tax=Dietzia sp. NCCP-2495 TaxID=2934675 RepID=UPI00222FD331|nr:ABC transporter substrate-binding protein [Dietzia sp. NCCP-2495]GLB64598.1 ABC transporter substrate-binding protein [Dietzia sp. NCCP-2495]
MKKLPVAVLTASALTLAACGGGGDTESASGGGRVGEHRTPDESSRCTGDQAGGTITMGEYVMLPSFSPGQGHYGLRGGAQSAAVYDRLMRWNPEAAEFEPQLAESLESNDDNTVWTLKLREGVTFSNGDPLTADDVAFTMNLHKDPAVGSTAKTDVDEIETVRVIDPLTVEFELSEPWVGFPFALTRSAGEVIPEDAYTEAGAEEWAANPIGAGAFTVASNTPGQEVVLEPNPTYYGGPVCPTLKFISIPGSQATLEAFQNAEVEVAFLRGAQFVHDAVDADLQGFLSVISSGRAIVMNNGAAGYDGVFTDERARKAVAHALDRDLLNDRLTGGLGQPTSALLAESSRFYDGQQGPDFDPELAAGLVNEIKSEGTWDGTVTLLTNTSPENVETGVMIKAMLDAVGFSVTLDNVPQSQQAARLFGHDYEMTIGGLNPSDADPSASFTAYVTPGGPTNNSGVDNAELAEAGRALKTASGLDEQIAALNRFQEVQNEIMPFTIFANAEEYVAVDEKVKGLAPTSSGVMLFDGAYIENP